MYNWLSGNRYRPCCLGRPQILVWVDRLAPCIKELRRFRYTAWTVMNTASVMTHSSTLLTPWSRVLLERLTGSAASKEIPRNVTVLTSARHLSQSSANSIQSPQSPLTSRKSILILSSHLRLGLPSVLFPSIQFKHPIHIYIKYGYNMLNTTHYVEGRKWNTTKGLSEDQIQKEPHDQVLQANCNANDRRELK
jgi:hypothetical protein